MNTKVNQLDIFTEEVARAQVFSALAKLSPALAEVRVELRSEYFLIYGIITLLNHNCCQFDCLFARCKGKLNWNVRLEIIAET